ncbi:MAG: hypothetical protein ABW061_25130 [Polyangiaceae bacterium]
MKALILCALLGFSWSLAGTARAADDGAAEDKPPAAEPAAAAEKAPDSAAKAKEAFGHKGQFGLRAGLVGGYNMIFRYDQSPLCTPPQAGKDPQKVCGHGAPLAFDLAASYALLDSVEPFVFLRLGFKGETQTHTLPMQVLGLGARVYTMSDSAFKIFIEPALAWEFEGGTSDAAAFNPKAQYKKDLLIHLAAGPQFDFSRYAGVYLDAGLTTGILRAIHTELELQLGLQARLP